MTRNVNHIDKFLAHKFVCSQYLLLLHCNLYKNTKDAILPLVDVSIFFATNATLP